jgi:hypothetical protein
MHYIVYDIIINYLLHLNTNCGFYLIKYNNALYVTNQYYILIVYVERLFKNTIITYSILGSQSSLFR